MRDLIRYEKYAKSCDGNKFSGEYFECICELYKKRFHCADWKWQEKELHYLLFGSMSKIVHLCGLRFSLIS